MNLKKSAYFLILFFPIVAYSTFVTPPSSSAGVVERPIEKEYEAEEVPAEKELPLLEFEEPENQFDMSDESTVFVSSIVFVGNTVFSNEKLQRLIQNKIPHELSMKEIREICAIIRAKYVQEGYFLTKVYPPAQEIHHGMLLIEIIEGKLGKVSVEGNKYYKTSFIEGYFSQLQGKPINYDKFIKTLLLLNENSDMSAGGIFKKGQEPGTADLIVRVEDKRPIHLFLDYNNYGSHLNSQKRAGGRFDYGNLFTQGDTFSLAAVGGTPIERLRFLDVIYRAFISNTWRTQIEGSYLYSDFHVTAFRPLHLKGRSQIGTVKAKQPHLRTRRLNTDYSLAFDYKQVQNFAGGQITSFDKLRELTVGVHLDYIDTMKGRNIGDVFYVQGIPHIFGGSSCVSSNASREGGGGLFSIFRLNYKRLQNLPSDTFLFLNFNGQLSPYKLTLPEQFYIGGVDTVRGYPLASGLGDNGYFFNIEARLPPFGIASKKVPYMDRTWKEFFQFVAFIDQGQTFLNNHPDNETHHVHMISTGAGFRLTAPYGLGFSFDLAFPLSEQKKSSTTIVYFKITWQLL